MVIYDDRHQVLVMQRNDDAEFWQSVTGTLEAGETPFATALREVQEETGIDIQAQSLQLVDCQKQNQYRIRPQWQHKYPPGQTLNTEHCFALQVPTGVPIAMTEHSALQWLSKQDAASKVWSPSNQQAILAYVPD